LPCKFARLVAGRHRIVIIVAVVCWKEDCLYLKKATLDIGRRELAESFSLLRVHSHP